MTMHQEVWEPTHEEKRAMFELVWMGYREAARGLPPRTGRYPDTASQRLYRRGHEAWKTQEEEG